MTEDKNLMMDVEYGIDSRYKSDLESVSEATALMEARLRRMKMLSNDQITKAKLLQLKLKMEEFINHPVYDNHNHFSNFLKFYIDSIYSKRSIFAKDINVDPVSLSQVINNHREPKDEFISVGCPRTICRVSTDKISGVGRKRCQRRGICARSRTI